MKYGREEILEKVKRNDTDFFYRIYDESYANKDEVEIVYDQNLGDGNEYYITIYFKKMDLYVSLSGVYSSWESPSWDYAKFAEPFEYTETRYKPVTLEYMRDKTLKEVLKSEDETK